MRRGRLLVLSLLIPACSTQKPGTRCPEGQVLAGGACVVVCDPAVGGCPAGSCCQPDNLCGPCTVAAPTITAVDGTGAADGSKQRITDRIAVIGTGLAGAELALDGAGGQRWVLARCSGAAEQDTRVEVELPSTIAPGSYVLTAQNAAGTCTADLQLLKGADGASGTWTGNVGQFVTEYQSQLSTGQRLPGTLAGSVDLLALRGVNGSLSGLEQSLVLNGNEQIAAPADGLWLGVLSRATHAPSANTFQHNRAYGTSDTDLDALLIVLDQLTADRSDFVVLVSRGDVSGIMLKARAAGAGGSLADRLVLLGASDTVRNVRATESFVFAGYGDIGAGNGVLSVSSTGAAEARVVLLDDGLLGPHTADPTAVPVGTILPFAGSAAPAGWLLCNGQAVDRGRYALLFATIGTAYGAGNGTTTFAVPDLRGRTAIGAGQGAGLANRTLGQAVGEESHKLTALEMPSHTHDWLFGLETDDQGSGGSWPEYTRAGGRLTDSIGSAGGDLSHNNMQPSLVTNYIIRF